jgi:DNA-binding transcriptional regulator YdaS (Cro superfamily)
MHLGIIKSEPFTIQVWHNPVVTNAPTIVRYVDTKVASQDVIREIAPPHVRLDNLARSETGHTDSSDTWDVLDQTVNIRTEVNPSLAPLAEKVQRKDIQCPVNPLVPELWTLLADVHHLEKYTPVIPSNDVKLRIQTDGEE